MPGIFKNIGTGIVNLPRRATGHYGQAREQALLRSDWNIEKEQIRINTRAKGLQELTEGKGQLAQRDPATNEFYSLTPEEAGALTDDKQIHFVKTDDDGAIVSTSQLDVGEASALEARVSKALEEPHDAFQDKMAEVRKLPRSLLGSMKRHPIISAGVVGSSAGLGYLITEKFEEPAPAQLDPAPAAGGGAPVDTTQAAAAQGIDLNQLQTLMGQVDPRLAQAGGQTIDPRVLQQLGLAQAGAPQDGEAGQLQALLGQLDPRDAQAGGMTIDPKALAGAASPGGQTQAIDLNALNEQLAKAGQ
ncbi:MAG: hypothetical protein ACT4TC_18815 [Myxococcaceae bacterium]